MHGRRVAPIEERREPALAEAARLRRRAARLGAGHRDAAKIGNDRRRQAAQPRPQTRRYARRRTSHGSISTATISTTPRKAGTAPGGNCATAETSIFSPPTSMMRVTGTPSRSTLSIRPMKIAPRHEPMTRPRPPKIAAPPTITEAMAMSSAPMPKVGSASLLCATFINPASHGAQRGQDIGAHAHEAGVDAGVARRLLVAARRVGRPAERRIGEGDRRDRRNDQEDDDLIVEAERVDFAEAEEVGVIVRLDLEGDVLAAGQAEDDAAADEQHGQRGDEGGHLEDRDEKAVDQPDGQAEREAPDTAVVTSRSK